MDDSPPDPLPLLELGVNEAYRILTERLAVADLPPLDAFENEDWGRDLLLNRLADHDDATLARLGLCRGGFGDVIE